MTPMVNALGKMGYSFICIALGLCILIPGLYLVISEYKKEHGSACMQILGVVIIAIGVMIGVGGSCSI